MNKFVIVKDSEGFKFRYANIDLHNRLVFKNDKVFGGGMFDLNDEDSVMTLYGKSDEFGAPKWLDIKRWIELKKSQEKIHIDEDLKGFTLRWLSGYDDNWDPIYLDFTDMFVFDWY